MNEHTHAIIIIKNNNGDYLQYFDNRWNSFLFPNCKLINANHQELIFTKLVEDLKLPIEITKFSLVFEKTHSKFSESAKTEKLYHHYFYEIDYTFHSSITQDNEFSINSVKFKWLSLSDLKSNPRIKEVNSDIIGYITEIEQNKKPY